MQPEGLEKPAISPITLKPRLLELIGRGGEALPAPGARPRSGQEMNRVVDPEVIDALYASRR